MAIPILVPASTADLPAIMTIIDQAKAALKAAGSPQWQTGYPNQATIETDLAAEQGWILRLEQTVVGYLALVVGDEPRNRYFLVGALTANRSLTYFALHRMGRNLGVTVTQPMIKPDETPEEVVVLEGPDWRELLVQYAEMSAKAMNVKPIDATHNLTGYCTWYYYYADVTEADFLENLKALKDNQNGPYKAQVVQIDDGYQAFQGDWLDQDPSWPTPLETIGKQISDQRQSMDYAGMVASSGS